MRRSGTAATQRRTQRDAFNPAFTTAHVRISGWLQRNALHRRRAACSLPQLVPLRAVIVAVAQAISVQDTPVAPAEPEHGGAGQGSPELDPVQQTDLTPSFARLGVEPAFLSGLRKMGVIVPSPIQELAIPRILTGVNCAIQSYTGSGKTLAYMLPAMTLALRREEELHRAAKGKPVHAGVQVLVVAPSQELCMQIMRVAQDLLPYEARHAVQQCIGGANPARQREALQLHRPLVVVGTPGRLALMVREGALKLHTCPLLVLDEADQLLAAHFSEDMVHIGGHTGKRLPLDRPRQTVVVSATLSATAMAKFGSLCPSPVYVSAGTSPVATPAEPGAPGAAKDGAPPSWGWGAKGWEGPASVTGPRNTGSIGGVEQVDLVPSLPPNLQHLYVVCDERRKTDTLRRCIHALDIQKALVFMNFQERLQDTRFKLEARGMPVSTFHGEMNKLDRQNMLTSFRRGEVRCMVVSDVAARGLDISGCDAVFNLELPSNAAHYAHRAGRTGRLGATTPGVVVSIVGRREEFVVEKLSRKLGVPIMEAHVANGRLVMGPEPVRVNNKTRRPPRGEGADRDGTTRKAAMQQDSQTDHASLERPPSATAQAGSSGSSPGGLGDHSTAATRAASGSSSDTKDAKAPISGDAARGKGLRSTASARTGAAAADVPGSSQKPRIRPDKSKPAVKTLPGGFEIEGDYFDDDDEIELEDDKPNGRTKAKRVADLQRELEEIQLEKAQLGLDKGRKKTKTVLTPSERAPSQGADERWSK